MEDSQDWEWEVLLPQSDNHDHNLNLNCLPNSEEEEGESSFSSGDVIRFDYFSIGYDYHRQTPSSEVEMKTETAIYSDIRRQDFQRDDPQFGDGSWMDPGHFPRSGTDRADKRRRNSSSSSSSSESSDSNGDGSGSSCDPRTHLLIIQPHSDCTQQSSSLVHFNNRNNKEGFGAHTLEPSDRFSKCHLGSAPPPPQLLLGDASHGTGTRFEIESSSRSLSGNFDPQIHKGTPAPTPAQAQKEEELEPPHGAAHSCFSSDTREEKIKDMDVDMVVQEAEVEEKDINFDLENEKRSVAWWRVPLEVLKYCVMRVNPIWSFSVAAAALMGFVLFRRRWLSKMKPKSQGLHLNITVDDKKVSQFMSRAARLNDAFSVVKRVPIIRPSLPAPGLAPWPMMSFR